tara:strand:+ start:28806 stop:32135 length:3330 start_codon:yes stop_codon:yes gene_type:complete
MAIEDRIADHVRMSETSLTQSHTRHARHAWRFTCAVLLAFMLLVAPRHTIAQSPDAALFQAVELNDMQAVEAAIAAGADLGAKNADGMTPADVAVDLGHFRIAHELLAKRTAAANTAPRVTDKGKQALTKPRARIAEQKPVVVQPSPALADLTPPKKPTPPAQTAAPMAPETDVPGMPGTAAPSPAPDLTTPPGMIESRPDDEMAQSTPTESAEQKMAAAPENEGGSFLGSVWGGIKSVVTLGGLIGADSRSDDQKAADEAGTPRRAAPADRFSDDPRPASSENARETARKDSGQTSVQDSGSAGRLVDRMTGIIGSEPPRENAFGLPESPVLPPLEPAPGQMEMAERTPSITAPLSVDVPGLTPPVDPSLAAPPGLTSKMPGLPGLAELPDGPAPPDPEAMPVASEVPGIIPPPGDVLGEIPGLPPGLEALPGSETGELRRPNGLLVPEDPTALPAPQGDDIQSRLRRIDEILNRSPEQGGNRYLTPQAPDEPAMRTAPRKAPVSEATPNPLLEIPRGVGDGHTSTSRATATPIPPRSTAPTDGPRDPAEILRRAKESDAVLAERKIFGRNPRISGSATPDRLGGHALQPPNKGITAREEPATRMFDRLSNLTGNPYENEDVHGLPVVRPSIDGTTPPRKDITVAEIPDPRQDKADAKIHALARFFKGDQEEEIGMVPPPSVTPVQAEPLPHVIDNMLPENDPARARIVDDKMLDLSGVERNPDAGRGTARLQPGATRTRDGSIDDRFLDRLTTVIGPAKEQPRAGDQATPPPPGTVGLGALDIPKDQTIPPRRPEIPDPWTMTVEKSGPTGEKQTLGVSTISPEDGTEIKIETGVVSEMVGRIRQLLGGPDTRPRDGNNIKALDDADRQAAAEQLLGDALRDGTPAALPDQNQWPVTEVEARNAPPGVPPAPRPGALSRTSLTDVVLSMGESVTLENTLPPQQDGIDPLNACVKKNRGTTLFCVEPVDWPSDLRPAFVVPTILYTGPMAITRYDQGSPTRFHSLFSSEDFEDVIAYFQVRYGEPTEIWKRSIAPLAKPRMDNPTVTWRSRDTRSNAITVLEVRKFDDSRGGFPDTNRGAVMLYYLNAPSIFPQVSSHELMRLRRPPR